MMVTSAEVMPGSDREWPAAGIVINREAGQLSFKR